MSDLDEARQLNERYRTALERILRIEQPWCRMYAECDHEGCKASHASYEIATAALNVRDDLWVPR